MDTPLNDSHLSLYRKQLDKLVVLTQPEWDVFSKHLYARQLRKKEYFIQSGEVCKEVGLIVSGSVRLYYVKDGEEITSYFCLDSDFITSYKSYLMQQPSLPYVQALENTMLICFTQKSMEQLLDNPVTALKMERFGRKIAEYLICCYEERVQSFVTQTAEERYGALLISNSPMLQRIPQHYLANYLGITPVSLSRIRKRIFEPVKQPV